jgi:hypothetical protein
MTLNEFTQEFRTKCENQGWALSEFKRKLRNKKMQCPITALAYQKTGNIYSTSEWRKAANKLQLDLKDAVSLVQAADREMFVKVPRLEELREKLLSIVSH